VSRHNQEIGLDLDYTWEMTANSDHYSFVSRNIPVLMPFTGLHEDYHRPSDDAEKINTAGMERIVRLLFLVSQEIAETPHRHTFRADARRESPALRQQFERAMASPPPRMGVSWKVTEGQEGVELIRVEAQSPAGQSGLRVGDRLIKLNDKAITDENQLRVDLLASRSPISVTLIRAGEKEPLTLSVRILGEPVRVGVTWRDDDAEPGCIVVTQVVPGSAAHLAGLKERDRVYEVAGKLFKNGEEFRTLVTTLPAPIEILIDREGRMQTLKLAVPPAATE
jgi:C-terminal processing protease CtpA/Prc